MKPTHYKVTPVSTPPETEGTYTVVFPDGTMQTTQFDHQYGFHSETIDCDSATHWLRPISAPLPEEVSDVQYNEWIEHFESDDGRDSPTNREVFEWMRDRMRVLITAERDKAQSTRRPFSLDELISKFDNGEERFRNDAMFNAAIEQLHRGGDVYKIIDHILKSNSETMSLFTDHMQTCISHKHTLFTDGKGEEK